MCELKQDSECLSHSSYKAKYNPYGIQLVDLSIMQLYLVHDEVEKYNTLYTGVVTHDDMVGLNQRTLP